MQYFWNYTSKSFSDVFRIIWCCSDCVANVLHIKINPLRLDLVNVQAKIGYPPVRSSNLENNDFKNLQSCRESMQEPYLIAVSITNLLSTGMSFTADLLQSLKTLGSLQCSSRK